MRDRSSERLNEFLHYFSGLEKLFLLECLCDFVIVAEMRLRDRTTFVSGLRRVYRQNYVCLFAVLEWLTLEWVFIYAFFVYPSRF